MGAFGFVGSFTVAGPAGDAERVGGVNVTGASSPIGCVGRAWPGVFAGRRRARCSGDGGPERGIWRRRFAGDPGVVGTSVLINARPTTVIGILPARYRHVEESPDRSADVFVPWAFNRAAANRGGHFIRAVGRLAPGASIDAARAELDTIAARLERDYPVSNHGLGVRLSPLSEAVIAGARQACCWCRLVSRSCW